MLRLSELAMIVTWMLYIYKYNYIDKLNCSTYILVAVLLMVPDAAVVRNGNDTDTIQKYDIKANKLNKYILAAVC